MKRTLLLLGVVCSVWGYSQKANVISNERLEQHHDFTNELQTISEMNDQMNQSVDWYNYGLVIYSNTQDRSVYSTSLFSDTTVHEGDYRPFRHLFGQVFDPTGSYFDQVYTHGAIDANYSYTLDSLKFNYTYVRRQTASPDTLEIQYFTLNEMYQGAYGSEVFATPYYDNANNTCTNPIHTQKVLLTDSDVNTSINNELKVEVQGLNAMAGNQPIAVVVKYIPGNPYSLNDSLAEDGVVSGINNFSFVYIQDRELLHDESYNHMLYANTAQRYGEATGTFADKLHTGIDYSSYYYQALMSFGITATPNSDILVNQSADSLCGTEDVAFYLADSAQFDNYSWTITGPENFASQDANPEFTFSTPGSYDLTVSADKNGVTKDTTITGAVVLEETPTITFAQDTITISVADTAGYVLPTPTLTPESAIGFYFTEELTDFFGNVITDNLVIGANDILYAGSNGDCIDFASIVLLVEEESVNTSIQVNDAQLFITPNPANNFITINGLNLTGSDQLEVFAIDGKKVTSDINVQGTELNINKLSTGIYFVQVVKNGEVFTQRFIKE